MHLQSNSLLVHLPLHQNSGAHAVDGQQFAQTKLFAGVHPVQASRLRPVDGINCQAKISIEMILKSQVN